MFGLNAGMPGTQRSFDELGSPLHNVTFCVFDVETTGGNAETCQITEIGAVKVRGGEVLGTFRSLVNPGCAIPRNITVITGITDQLVLPAPSIDQVLPAFLEFMGGAVVVGHNVRFDWAFLHAAIRVWGGPMLGNQRIDTLALARRLLADEMPQFSLGELARRLRLPHQPAHRALDDAWATTDLLHVLIERATSWGVTGLDDLVALPTIAGHPQWKKLSLTNDLPRKPGVYLFHDVDGRALYVGKATDLRSRVRSYFSSDTRRKVAQLLRETHRISHRVCSNTLEAEVVELRLIHELRPRFNQKNKRPFSPTWVKLTTAEQFPRLAIVRNNTAPGCYLGPFPFATGGNAGGGSASHRLSDPTVLDPDRPQGLRADRFDLHGGPTRRGGMSVQRVVQRCAVRRDHRRRGRRLRRSHRPRSRAAGGTYAHLGRGRTVRGGGHSP